MAKTDNYTLQEIIDAAKKDGYDWNKGGRYEFKEGGQRQRVSYCVLEQAARNLGKESGYWQRLNTALNLLDKEYFNTRKKPGDMIWQFNDELAESYDEVITFMEETLTPYGLDTVITVED